MMSIQAIFKLHNRLFAKTADNQCSLKAFDTHIFLSHCVSVYVILYFFLNSSIKEFQKTVYGYFVPLQNKPIRNKMAVQPAVRHIGYGVDFPLNIEINQVKNSFIFQQFIVQNFVIKTHHSIFIFYNFLDYITAIKQIIFVHNFHMIGCHFALVFPIKTSQ